MIFGLGNPGIQYAQTRHNAGFHVVDRLAAALGFSWSMSKRDRAELAQGMVGDTKLILAKPQTYMNESGHAVLSLVQFYKVPLTAILVIADDLDLPVGRIRLREKGSDGGQRGVRSIISLLGSNDFARLRIGIGRPIDHRIDPIAHVLAAPQGEEKMILTQSEEDAAAAALLWFHEGPQAVMNRYNADPKPPRTMS